MNLTLYPSVPQEILSSLTAIKQVFNSAKGPRVIKLKEDVDRLEKYILSGNNTGTTLENHQDNVSVASQVQEIANRLEGITEQQSILSVITEILHCDLNADRVVIYRFFDSEKAKAIAEFVNPNYISLLNQILPYNCFNLQSINSNTKFLPRVVEMSFSQLQLWQNFQVISGLLLPLFIREKLWGVLMIHYCRESKEFLPHELNLLQQIGMMLTITLISKTQTPSILDNHQSAERENTISSQVDISTKKITELYQKINVVIGNCKAIIERLINFQKNYAITSQNINHLTTECQEAEGLINLVKKVTESLDILSLNTGIQATEPDSEEEFITIAQQVETIATQARETSSDIEDWIMEVQNISCILDEGIKPITTDLNGIFNTVEAMDKQLQEILKITSK